MYEKVFRPPHFRHEMQQSKVFHLANYFLELEELSFVSNSESNGKMLD